MLIVIWQCALRLRDTRVHAVRNVFWKSILKLANQKSLVQRAWATWFWRWRCAVTRCRAWRKLLLIRCIAVQKRAFQFTKSRIYHFSRARQQINLLGIMLSKKLPSCPAPCASALPPPESSCSRSSYQRFLVSELKYTFPNTFRTARARVSCNLNIVTIFVAGVTCTMVTRAFTIELYYYWIILLFVLKARSIVVTVDSAIITVVSR